MSFKDKIKDIGIKYDTQKSSNDQKQHLTLARLYYSKGQEQLHLGNMHASSVYLRDALKESIENTRILSLSSNNLEHKLTYIKRAQEYNIKYAYEYLFCYLTDQYKGKVFDLSFAEIDKIVRKNNIFRSQDLKLSKSNIKTVESLTDLKIFSKNMEASSSITKIYEKLDLYYDYEDSSRLFQNILGQVLRSFIYLFNHGLVEESDNAKMTDIYLKSYKISSLLKMEKALLQSQTQEELRKS